ncbi:hypothetical protein BegalDRAFT_0515 [Beggiatoa alba B18LD]|uniref:Peptidase M15C domain-containing protein n=1 Tax=Beggiatoa alba B18LD TaxID=395493 RepID=I3CCU0_9GAMM|nr:M15 family metallopeptidase [Beggiatoa alba]EIJ41433.1 hypothetical protein BegalDRAFT_0515 [Beggiatoa alba B18LD]
MNVVHFFYNRLPIFIFTLFSLWQLPASADNGLRCLVEAYPQFLSPETDINGNELLWLDGTRMIYDDGKQYTDFEELLNNGDLKEQLSIPYSLAPLTQAPAFNEDAGRIRHIDFFKKMYGSTEAQVRKQLKKVSWLPSKTSILFSSVNGADEALAEVGKRIAQQPDLIAYVSNPVGSFNWRTIQGTSRLSNHSFGTAVDFQLPKNLYKYWLWGGCKPNKPCTYPTQVLQDTKLQRIVTIFEEFGFIWGGKWYHFDTMHFEYRPELIHCSTNH